MSFFKTLLPTRARGGDLIGDLLPALAAACATSVPRQGETTLLVMLGTWQQGSTKEKEENERREPSPCFPMRGMREPCSCRVLQSLLGIPPGSPGKMVPAFFHIVPDGWALPEPFQHGGEGEPEQNGTFFHFPSFHNFSAITKSHIAANFPASVHTGILQRHRNSSMRDVGSSDAPRPALCLPTLPEPPTYQLPALRSSGCKAGHCIPPTALACGGRGKREARGPRSCAGTEVGMQRGSRGAVARQPQSVRKGCCPCGAGEWDNAEN